MPFLGAHWAMPSVACGNVKPVRTMYGDCSVIMAVAAAITTIGTLAWVAIGAVDSASGVRPKPASTFTLSFTTSSCAMRLVVSATLASSRTISSIFLPATVEPFCAMYRRAAAWIWRPVDAKGPVMGRIRPILTTSWAWAWAGRPAAPITVMAAASLSRVRLLFMRSP